MGFQVGGEVVPVVLRRPCVVDEARLGTVWVRRVQRKRKWSLADDRDRFGRERLYTLKGRSAGTAYSP